MSDATGDAARTRVTAALLGLSTITTAGGFAAVVYMLADVFESPAFVPVAVGLAVLGIVALGVLAMAFTSKAPGVTVDSPSEVREDA
jgi:hypothetical protein